MLEGVALELFKEACSGSDHWQEYEVGPCQFHHSILSQVWEEGVQVYPVLHLKEQAVEEDSS